MVFLRIFLLFTIFLSGTLVQAQQDSLSGKDYTELAEMLKTHQTDTITAFHILNYYIEKSKSENKTERELEGYLSIAKIYFVNEYLEKSADALDKAILFRKENNINNQAVSTYGFAMVAYMRAGQLEKSYTATDSVLALANRNNDTNLRSTANAIVDVLDGMAGNYKKLIAKTKQKIENLKLQKDLSQEQKERQVKFNEFVLADSYVKMKEADSAAHYAVRYLKKSLAQSDSCSVKVGYFKLAEAEVLLGNFSTAHKNLQESVKYCKPITKFDSLTLGGIYGKMYYAQNKFKKTINTLENTLKTYTVTKNEEAYMDDIYKILANSYKETGEYKKANLYFEKYVNTKEQFARVKDTIKNDIREREISKFRAELLALEAENKEKESNLNYFLLGGSIIILALLFLLLKFYRNKKKNEAKFEALLAKIKAAEKPQDIVDTKDEVLEESSNGDVSEEVKTQILDGLKKLEEKEYFLSKECNSYNVAKKINTNTSYLSKVINSHFSKNFNTYINDLRINYTLVRLKDDVLFRSYSIQAIAEEVGYKSADSFTKYFKKDTGLNPSFYIKEIKNIV